MSGKVRLVRRQSDHQDHALFPWPADEALDVSSEIWQRERPGPHADAFELIFPMSGRVAMAGEIELQG
jgi:hypothetical protein